LIYVRLEVRHRPLSIFDIVQSSKFVSGEAEVARIDSVERGGEGWERSMLVHVEDYSAQRGELSQGRDDETQIVVDRYQFVDGAGGVKLKFEIEIWKTRRAGRIVSS